ncbi:EamA family transporter [Alphaproteobacteria bacterium]|nr:EamA family transporter [Alphaproteobacteria bacterium]
MINKFNRGLVSSFLGSFWWGFIGVIYFKYISFIGHIELVMHRCLWTAFILIITTFFLKKWNIFFNIISQKKNLISLFFSGLLIFTNWSVWIYAVANEKIIDASFGYFIMPIFSVLLGRIAFNINQSNYFILFYLFLFMSVGINKRIIEFNNIGNNLRPYNSEDIENLKKILYGFLSIVSFVFLIYIHSENSNYLFNSINLLYCNWLILNLILINFIYKTNTSHIYDIVDFIIKDKINIILGIGFIILFLINSI